MRYNGGYLASQGGWPHYRGHSDKRSDKPAVRQLPVACYAVSAIQDPFERNYIEPLSVSVNLVHPERILTYVAARLYTYILTPSTGLPRVTICPTQSLSPGITTLRRLNLSNSRYLFQISDVSRHRMLTRFILAHSAIWDIKVCGRQIAEVRDASTREGFPAMLDLIWDCAGVMTFSCITYFIRE